MATTIEDGSSQNRLHTCSKTRSTIVANCKLISHDLSLRLVASLVDIDTMSYTGQLWSHSWDTRMGANLQLYNYYCGPEPI